MAKNHYEWETTEEYTRNGERYRVQKVKAPIVEAGGAVGGAILGLFMFVYIFLFPSYTDTDFSNLEYLSKAESGAQSLILSWQQSNWITKGFINAKLNPKNEPTFDVKISKSLEPIKNRVSYTGKGVFHVVIETATKLTSKSGHSTTIYEVFYVDVQSPPEHSLIYRKILGDDWKLTCIEAGDKEPTLEELDEIIHEWSYGIN